MFVVAVAAVFASLLVWLMSYLLKLRRRGAVSGKDSIIGGIGTAMQDFTDEGKIWLEGEAWAARSSVVIKKDQQVIVLALDGLVLEVEPITEADDALLQT